MTKLWNKSNTKKNNPAVNQYIIAKDCSADTILLPYDIQSSIAHAKMLKKVSLITEKEAEELILNLQEILELFTKGEFKLKQSDEDCHTAIENYLVEKLGDTGKKIHTARSRNDQILTATRLYSKEMLANTQKTLLDTAQEILLFAEKNEFIPMPGYTHTQQAMPSSVGQWASAFVESLLDDYKLLAAVYDLNDQNPLGSASGFGTSLPIDRNFTTTQLGFSKTQSNCLYCQNSRGKIESAILSALVQVMLTLGKAANDIILFTSYEFNFFKVDDSLTTGSSIMPQKKNLDILEVLRANLSVIFSLQIQIQSVSQNLISGYHKDLKISKQALIDAFKITQESLEIIGVVFQNLEPNSQRLFNSFSPGIFATDVVNDLVQQGVPFRTAYQQVGSELDSLQKSIKT